MAIPVLSKVGKKVFGTRNERMVKRYLKIVDLVSAQQDAMAALTDAQLRAKTDEFRERIADGTKAEDLIPEVFAVAREAMDRSVGIRNIFNPVHAFDPDRLPDDARKLFDAVQAEIDATEDRQDSTPRARKSRRSPNHQRKSGRTVAEARGVQVSP